MSQACTRCRRQKRKCDKLVPVCSLCKRLNKSCSYPVTDAVPSRPVAMPSLCDLTPSNIRHTLEAQVSSIVGDGIQLQETVAAYFRSVHVWLPVISETTYYAQLSRFRIEPVPADFSVLTLCMFLVCAMPVDGELSAHAQSLYALIKSLVALVEAVGLATGSLEFLQARLLLTVFEIGHAIYPAAYISAGANVRAAVTLGAGAASLEALHDVFPDPQKAEEAQRTWQGILITDRYASLESGNEPIALRGRHINAGSHRRTTKDASQNDSFAELVHASELLGQTLAHIHENYEHILLPPLNGVETGLEALHILGTLTANLSMFQGGVTKDPLSSSSLATYRSAMLEVLEFASHINLPASERCIQTSISILDSLVQEIGHETKCVSATAKAEILPIFLIHCIYKAAIIYLRDARLSGDVDPNPAVRPLQDRLRYLGRRWRAASHYAQKVEQATRDSRFTA